MSSPSMGAEMSVVATIGGRRVQLVHRRDVVSVRDRIQAERVVEALVRDHGHAAVAELVADRCELGATRDEMVAKLISLIVEGRFVAVRTSTAPRLLSAPRATPLVDPHRPVPLDEPTAIDWVGVRLIREDETPIVDEPFEVRLPDGTIEHGRTDHEGRARYDGEQKGRCRVSFPRIWPPEWRGAEGWPTSRGSEADSRPASSTPPEGREDAAPAHPASELVSEPEDNPPGTTWIAIEVEDRDGDAVVGAGVQVMLPDGDTRTVTTDELGRIELTGLETDGVCKLGSIDEGLEIQGRCATGSGHVVVARRTEVRG